MTKLRKSEIGYFAGMTGTDPKAQVRDDPAKDGSSVIHLVVQRLPEGPLLGTSDDVQGLVVQADTLDDLLVAADDIAMILIEQATGRRPAKLQFEYHERPYTDAA